MKNNEKHINTKNNNNKDEEEVLDGFILLYNSPSRFTCAPLKERGARPLHDSTFVSGLRSCRAVVAVAA